MEKNLSVGGDQSITGALNVAGPTKLTDSLTVGSLANALQTNQAIVVADADGSLKRQEIGSNSLEALNCDGDGFGAKCFGQGSGARGDATTAVGSGAQAEAAGATTLGNAATASGANALALGRGAMATHANAIAIGAGVLWVVDQILLKYYDFQRRKKKRAARAARAKARAEE